ncbi:MAG: cupin domain-containing protein [Rhizomicrobium sp.]
MKGMTGEEALKTLARLEETYTKVIVANEYDVGVHKPNEMDTQSPHLRDEIYTVISGRGTFHRGDEDRAFGPGDMLFAPRGAEHGFREFPSDFAP